MNNKLSPIAEPFNPEIAEILAKYPQENGYILKLFRAFANSKRFLTKGMPNLLDAGSPLSLRIREIVILRVTAKNNCEYEWGVHVAIFAKAADLTQEQIAATRIGPAEASCWTSKEQSLIAAIDSLLLNGQMNDTNADAFNTDWSAEEQLEILAICGAYQTASYVANTSKISPEAFGARFPK